MDEQERTLGTFDKRYEKELAELDGRIDKDFANFIVYRLMEEIDKKYGTIVEKPIFVEKKIEVLIPKYKTLDIEQVGLVRWLWRKVF